MDQGLNSSVQVDMEQSSLALTIGEIKQSEHKVKYHNIIITLASLLVVPTYLYGLRVLLILFASISTAVIIDLLCIHVFLRNQRLKYDYSGVVTAMITTMLMPATVPLFVPCFSVFIAIGIAKYPFGGVSYNIFNPACVGVAFSALSWPEYVLKYPVSDTMPGFLDFSFDLSLVQYFDSPSSLLKIGGTPKIDYFDVLLGDFVGPIGGTCIIVLVCCMIYLVFMKVIAKRVVFTAIAVVALIAVTFPRVSTGTYDSLVFEFCSGGFLFGLVFMINDPTTKPQTKTGQLFYGIIFGINVMFFKHFGAIELEIVYAVLLTNIFKHESDKRGAQFEAFLKNIFVQEPLLISGEDSFSKVDSNTNESTDLTNSNYVFFDIKDEYLNIDEFSNTIDNIDTKTNTKKVDKKIAHLLAKGDEIFGDNTEEKVKKPKKTIQRRTFYQRNKKEFDKLDGVLFGNPTIGRGLILAPVVVASYTYENSLILGLSFFIITFFTIIFSAIIPRKIPYTFRIIMYVLIACMFFVPTAMYMDYLFPQTVFRLGAFLPLLVSNSLIVVQSEARFLRNLKNYDEENKNENKNDEENETETVKETKTDDDKLMRFLSMATDLFFHCFGFWWVIIVIGIFREYVGSGTYMGQATNFAFKVPAVLLPFSGFIIVGFLSFFVKSFYLKLNRAVPKSLKYNQFVELEQTDATKEDVDLDEETVEVEIKEKLEEKKILDINEIEKLEDKLDNWNNGIFDDDE